MPETRNQSSQLKKSKNSAFTKPKKRIYTDKWGIPFLTSTQLTMIMWRNASVDIDNILWIESDSVCSNASKLTDNNKENTDKESPEGMMPREQIIVYTTSREKIHETRSEFLGSKPRGVLASYGNKSASFNNRDKSERYNGNFWDSDYDPTWEEHLESLEESDSERENDPQQNENAAEESSSNRIADPVIQEQDQLFREWLSL